MDEKPKSIWKKSWKGRSAVLIWCALVGVAIFLAILVTALGKMDTPLSRNLAAPALASIVIVASCLFVICAVIPFLRWLFWKHWRRTLFGLACFATLIALFYAEEDWRGKHDWEKFKREWEAKGEHFDWASVVPSPVPDNQNFALTPIWVESMKALLGPQSSRPWFGDKFAENGRTNFTDRLLMEIYHAQGWPQSQMEKIQVGDWRKAEMTDLKLWQYYYRSPSDGVSPNVLTNDFPVAPQPQSPAADVLLALSKYDSAIEELRQASHLPYARFPLNYDSGNPAVILFPHLSHLKACAQVLQLRAIAELQNGQSGKALDDVELMLRLTDSIRTEPILISHLVRIAMVNITLQPVWEGLAEHKWSDAQLAELDSELVKPDFLADYESAMRGERALAIQETENIRRTHKMEMFAESDSEGSAASMSIIGFHWMPSGFFYQTELAYARMHQQWLLPLADVQNAIVSPTVARNANKAEAAAWKHYSPYTILARILYPAFSPAVKKFAHAQSSVDLAHVAIALERYLLAHGEYPESLDALSPQFIAKLPHDIINGQPLHYRHEANGQFVLYSVGWNEKDDGGVVGLDRFRPQDPPNINQGDWVWRYPAK